MKMTTLHPRRAREKERARERARAKASHLASLGVAAYNAWCLWWLCCLVLLILDNYVMHHILQDCNPVLTPVLTQVLNTSGCLRPARLRVRTSKRRNIWAVDIWWHMIFQYYSKMLHRSKVHSSPRLSQSSFKRPAIVLRYDDYDEPNADARTFPMDRREHIAMGIQATNWVSKPHENWAANIPWKTLENIILPLNRFPHSQYGQIHDILCYSMLLGCCIF